MGRLISDRMFYRNHYMCSGEATSKYYCIMKALSSPACTSMDDFIGEICERRDFLAKWTDEGVAKYFKLSAILNHNAFLTSLIQV